MSNALLASIIKAVSGRDSSCSKSGRPSGCAVMNFKAKLPSMEWRKAMRVSERDPHGPTGVEFFQITILMQLNRYQLAKEVKTCYRQK
jgi:hypothetical protein